MQKGLRKDWQDCQKAMQVVRMEKVAQKEMRAVQKEMRAFQKEMRADQKEMRADRKERGLRPRAHLVRLWPLLAC